VGREADVEVGLDWMTAILFLAHSELRLVWCTCVKNAEQKRGSSVRHGQFMVEWREWGLSGICFRRNCPPPPLWAEGHSYGRLHRQSEFQDGRNTSGSDAIVKTSGNSGSVANHGQTLISSPTSGFHHRHQDPRHLVRYASWQ
jgi:hypothetical protein